MAVYSDEEDAESWQELLRNHPLFLHLQYSLTEAERKRNVMCEIRGDLFAWSSKDSVLLTTNLKRMVAYPTEDPIYQVLMCTHNPESAVTRLLPNPSGEYIALQCEYGVSVVTLPWHRGLQGEFGGGTVKVLCTTVPIARDFLMIHQDSPLLQVSWHPTKPFHLVLLTRKDSTLHVYSLANPDVEEWSLSLPNSPSAGLSMKDPVIAFGLWEDSTFLLQEDSNVTLAPLTPYTPPPPPLRVQPQMDDDCDNEAVTMLLLHSNPCVVVIATTSGLLTHCVYLLDDRDDMTDGSGHSKECLYIVDSISFDTEDSETFPSSLIPDPIHPHVYYVVHSEGVHQVTLPWLLDMENYNSPDTTSLKEKETQVTLLIQTEPGTNWPEGAVVVSEPMLGLTLITLTSDWDCIVQPLKRSESAPPVTECLHSPRRLVYESQPTGGGFLEEIRKILGPGTFQRVSSDRPASQADCYKFLSSEIKRLKQNHILSQRKAKDKILLKISTLQGQKQFLIAERVSLEDEIEEIAAMNEKLSTRVEHVREKCVLLEKRMISLLCRQKVQSPELSQAEEWMRDELEGFNSHMHVMHQKINEGRRKLEVCCGAGNTPKVLVSGNQSKTILCALTESGKSIKNMMEQVQGLKEVAYGPIGS